MMTKTKVCKCGHNKSDHSSRKINKKYIANKGQCQWIDCDCKRFEHDHTAEGGIAVLKMPDPIAPGKYESLNERKQPYKKTLHIGNLGSNGKPHKV